MVRRSNSASRGNRSSCPDAPLTSKQQTSPPAAGVGCFLCTTQRTPPIRRHLLTLAYRERATAHRQSGVEGPPVHTASHRKTGNTLKRAGPTQRRREAVVVADNAWAER